LLYPLTRSGVSSPDRSFVGLRTNLTTLDSKPELSSLLVIKVNGAQKIGGRKPGVNPRTSFA
jgi:hypothetical protein